MKNKKNLSYYLNLPWTYSIETELHKGILYYIIRVNELPCICTHNEDLNQGMIEIKEAIACAVEIYLEKGEAVPEPIDRSHYKGKILYRTNSERHFLIAKAAKLQNTSISSFLNNAVDKGLRELNL